MLCLLTGCHSDVECVTYGLPEGAKISYLVKDTETTALSAEPDKNKNEPDNNSLDGWHKIQYITNSINDVRRYDTIKIAVFDRNGELLKVSPEYNLTIEDRNYYWSKLAYNYNENRIEGIKVTKIDSFIAKWMLRLFILDWIFAVILIIICSEMNKKNYKIFPLQLALLNIPNIGIITLWTIDTFCDYFNPPGYTPDTLWNLYFGFIIVVISANVISIQKYLKCRMAAKIEKNNEKAPD